MNSHPISNQLQPTPALIQPEKGAKLQLNCFSANVEAIPASRVAKPFQPVKMDDVSSAYTNLANFGFTASDIQLQPHELAL